LVNTYKYKLLKKLFRKPSHFIWIDYLGLRFALLKYIPRTKKSHLFAIRQ